MVWIKNDALKSHGARKDVDSCVRISFRLVKVDSENPILSIYIGQSILNKIGLQEGDKVDFFIDESNKRKWLIKKAESVYEGYKLSCATKKNKSVLKIQITFHKAKLELREKDFKIRKASHDIDHGGIVIFGE